MDFLGGAVIKNTPDNAGDTRDVGWIPGSGRSLGGQNGNPSQFKKKKKKNTLHLCLLFCSNLKPNFTFSAIILITAQVTSAYY